MRSASATSLGPFEVVSLTRALVDIPSVTGEEGPVMAYLESRLLDHGWSCRRQPVADGRFNLWCTRQANPRVIFATHLDTVPPHFPSREDDRFVYGRGSCDAKGIVAAMICAAEHLVAAGVANVGMLFLVGEEVDSAGAQVAGRSGLHAEFLINGEPTDNHLVTGHKGVVLARVVARGKSAHSAYPEQGSSAIDRLVEVLAGLRLVAWPVDRELGPSHLNIGQIAGGEAPNVVAGHAEASLLIRTVAPAADYHQLLCAAVGDRAQVEILKSTEPQQLVEVAGFPTRVVSFSTDIPALRPIAEPLLIGPGSILEAHTADEKIAKQELRDGVEVYRELALSLLQSRRS